jgi:hypothetical protein
MVFKGYFSLFDDPIVGSTGLDMVLLVVGRRRGS